MISESHIYFTYCKSAIRSESVKQEPDVVIIELQWSVLTHWISYAMNYSWLDWSKQP